MTVGKTGDINWITVGASISGVIGTILIIFGIAVHYGVSTTSQSDAIEKATILINTVAEANRLSNAATHQELVATNDRITNNRAEVKEEIDDRSRRQEKVNTDIFQHMKETDTAASAQRDSISNQYAGIQNEIGKLTSTICFMSRQIDTSHNLSDCTPR
jgi:hypothetical protein